jgi:hypothetical protein
LAAWRRNVGDEQFQKWQVDQLQARWLGQDASVTVVVAVSSAQYSARHYQ